MLCNITDLAMPPLSQEFVPSTYNMRPFDIKLLQYKKPLIEKIRQIDGSSVTRFHASFTPYAIFNSNPNHRVFTKALQGSIDVSADGEDFNLKTVSTISEIQNIFIDFDDLLQSINHVILLNFDGFKERLIFFSEHLSELFYFNSLPSEEVFKQFNSMFPLDEMGNATFIQPATKSQYSWISVFVGLVNSVAIFTKSKDVFRYEFDINSNTMKDLTVKSLAYSNYKQYPTCGALLALLTIRNNVFLNEFSNGSISLKTDGYNLLKEIIDLVYELGIHTQCDTFVDEGIPEQAIIVIWNWLQLIDAIFAIMNGLKPIIDYDYCTPRLTESFKPVVILLRFVSEIFNNSKPISLTDMISALDTICSYITKFPAFDNFNSATLNFSGPSSWIKLTKTSLISTFQNILFKIKQSCDTLKANQIVDLKNDEVQLIDHLIETCEFQIVCSIIFSFKLMKELIEENLSGSNDFVRPIMILRVAFSHFISNSCGYLISHLTDLNIRTRKDLDPKGSCSGSKLLALSSIPLSQIESNLFKPLHEVDIQCNDIMNNLFNIFNDFNSLLEIIMTVHTLGMKAPDLRDSPVLKTQFRFLLSLCLLLRTLDDHKVAWATSHPNTPWKISVTEWKAIVEETKYRSSADLNKMNEDPETEFLPWDSWDSMENLFDDKQYGELFESIGLEFGKI